MVAIVVLLAAHPAPAGYNMLANGSFEIATVDPGAGLLSLPQGSTAINSWNVAQPVNYVGGFWQASQGNRSIGLNTSSSNLVGYIYQDFQSPNAGVMYQVSFDLAGDPTIGPAAKTMSVAKGTTPIIPPEYQVFTFDTTGKSNTNMGWTRKQWNFWASESSPIVDHVTFQSQMSGSGGPALDNVVLVPVNAFILNGSFEIAAASLNPPVPPGNILVPNGSAGLFGWTIANGITFIGPSFWQSSHRNFSTHLNSVNGPGSLSQSFTTIPGELYQVSFDLAGDPTGGPAIKTLRVSAAGLSQDFSFDTTGKSVGNMGWVTKNWTFRANSTSATLIFQSLDSGANGPALDNVKVVHPANLVLNGSFEDGPSGVIVLTLGSGSNVIKNWTVAGSIDYIGTYWTASQGGRSLDMNGVGAGSIEQTFLTTPGDTYNVTFDLAGNPSDPVVKTLRVSAAGRFQDFTFDTTGKTLTNMGWITKHFTFRAKWDTTTLLFETLTSGNGGPALDNVRVIRAPALTPQYLLLLLSD